MSDGAEPQDHVATDDGGVGGEHRRHTSIVSDGAEPQDHVAGWYETLARDTRYRGFSDVHVDTVRMPDGSEAEREVVDHADAVAMVPLLEDGTVLLLRQYRHPAGRYVLEIPAGTLDHEDESVTAAAQRELAEEIGYEAGRLEHLVTTYPSPGVSTERSHVYLVRDLTACGPPDGFEAQHEEADMEIVRLPLTAAVEQARRGEVTDAKTVIGLLLAHEHAERAPNRDPLGGRS